MSKTRSIVLCGLTTAAHVIATLLLRFQVGVGIDIAILFMVPFFSAMLSLKTDIRYSFIFAVASLLICSIIDFNSALLYILPTISVGIAYGLAVKNNLDGTSIVYILTIVEFGLFFISALLLKKIAKFDVIYWMQTILHFEGSNAYLGLGFLLIYCFAQAFMVHIATKSSLKKLKIEVKKTDKPSFFIILISIIGFIVAFFPFEKEAIIFFISILSIISVIPLVLYGYQQTEKPQIILMIQVGVFLVITLPLLKTYESLDLSYQHITAYLLLLLPPMGYGLYKLFFNKEEVKVK